MEQIILTGKQVFHMAIDRTLLMTKEGKSKTGVAVAPRPYYRASYGGITFTVGQAFLDALDKGEVAEIVLHKGTRQIDDPMIPGAKVSVDSIAFGNFVPKATYLGAAEFESKLREIEQPQTNLPKLNAAELTALQSVLKGLAAPKGE